MNLSIMLHLHLGRVCRFLVAEVIKFSSRERVISTWELHTIESAACFLGFGNNMIFFSDFDGTLTVEGSGLTRDFFEIIDHIHKHGHELVIVSGRSLSWGHFFLTHFPLKACIMEGGGVISYINEDG